MQDYRPYIEHSWSKLKHTTRQTATQIGSQELWTKLAGSLGKYHIGLCPLECKTFLLLLMEMTSYASLPKKSIHAERSVTIKKAMSQITKKDPEG
jgi:hypothetical protein